MSRYIKLYFISFVFGLFSYFCFIKATSEIDMKTLLPEDESRINYSEYQVLDIIEESLIDSAEIVYIITEDGEGSSETELMCF